jgi:hypothetical protein
MKYNINILKKNKIMTSKFLVRMFDNNIKNPELVYSNHFPKPMKKALEDVPKTSYILCPVYEDGEYQIGITGTVGKRENIIDGLARELGEEIGLTLKHKNSAKHITSKNVRGKRYDIYTSHIDDLTPVKNNKHDFVFTRQGKDNRNKKVGCIVYGEEYKFREFLSMSVINRYGSDDVIIGLVAIPVKSISNIFL